jgi:hypothetical protein
VRSPLREHLEDAAVLWRLTGLRPPQINHDRSGHTKNAEILVSGWIVRHQRGAATTKPISSVIAAVPVDDLGAQVKDWENKRVARAEDGVSAVREVLRELAAANV